LAGRGAHSFGRREPDIRGMMPFFMVKGGIAEKVLDADAASNHEMFFDP
jgi:hypothetical protein